MDYYSKRLATCSSDRTIKIFELHGAAQTHVADITGHEGPVWQVSWAHPKFGVLLASCSYDSKIMVHRETAPNSWVCVYTSDVHKASVNAVAWAPYQYGLILACCSADGKVSVHSHQPDDSWSKAVFDDSGLGCNGVSWAPFGHLGGDAPAGGAEGQPAASPVKRIVTASCDNKARVWVQDSDDAEWRRESELSMHKDWVRGVAWAPRGGAPCNTVVTCSEDTTVIKWTQSAEGGEWVGKAVNQFAAPVWSVSWSLTGNILAVSSGDHSVTLWKETLENEWMYVREALL